MAAVASPVRPPTSTRYVFGDPIGSGGAGSVYRARDTVTGGPVAIKVLHCRMTENQTLHKRLATEFRAATQLEHPNIVRGLDSGRDPISKRRYLILEYVDGPSALALMERQLLTAVLRHTQGNQVQASRILGITRGSLRTKIRSLGITIERAVWSENDQAD